MKISRLGKVAAIILLNIACTSSEALASAPDSVVTKAGAFDPELLRSLQSDPELRYQLDPVTISIWDRLGMLWEQFISTLLQLNAGGDWQQIVIVILSILVLVYTILRLLRIDVLKIFYGDRKAVRNMLSPQEDIRRMDFDALVAESIARGDYRSATRLRFLHTLRLLADRDYVTWHPGKTNFEYVAELRKSPFSEGFGRLSHYFEYAWYGNFSIDETTFGRIDAVFAEIKNALA
jgi:Domain of unknown function (DUF4129)